MKPLSADTPLEVERVWIEAQRRLGPEGRLRRCIELTEFCWNSAREAVRRAHPELSEAEQDLLFLSSMYGEELAREFIAKRQEIGFYAEADAPAQESSPERSFKKAR